MEAVVSNKKHAVLSANMMLAWNGQTCICQGVTEGAGPVTVQHGKRLVCLFDLAMTGES